MPCIWIYVPELQQRQPLGKSFPFELPGRNKRQRNRGNPASHPCSNSIEQCNRQRSTSRRSRDEDERGLRNQFEIITFESITVDAIVSYAPPTDEAFVTMNVDLHNSSCPTAVKVKLDPRAKGNLIPLRLYHSMYPQNLTPEGLPNQESSNTHPQCSKLIKGPS